MTWSPVAKSRNSGPHIRNYAGTFVAQYRRESIGWVTAYDGVIVAMAGARASYIDANLARPRPFEVDLLDRQWGVQFSQQRGLHASLILLT